MANIIWKDRKRIIFGLPWSFTRYSLTEDKLLIDTGAAALGPGQRPPLHRG